MSANGIAEQVRKERPFRQAGKLLADEFLTMTACPSISEHQSSAARSALVPARFHPAQPEDRVKSAT